MMLCFAEDLGSRRRRAICFSSLCERRRVVSMGELLSLPFRMVPDLVRSFFSDQAH